MKRRNLPILSLITTIVFLGLISVKPANAAITDTPPYGQSVETWWQGFWANPLSPNYIPLGQVPSPTNSVTLQSGASIQSAIDSLPNSGGTIFLEPGTYSGNLNIFARQNIHIRGKGNSPTDVTLTGTIYVAGCKEASYGYQPSAYGHYVGNLFANDPYYIDCGLNRKAQNIYFYNFTMDGQGRSNPQHTSALANGVVFDKIIWQGLSRDPGDVHSGHANAHVVTDNIWFRGNIFRGTYQTAAYLDGCHACGLVESTIEANFYNAGLVFLNNNDLDYDYNRNGRYEDSELRNGRYMVVAHTNFVPTSTPANVTTYDWLQYAVIFEANNVLAVNNSVSANLSSFFASLKGGCSYHTNTVMDFYDLVFKNNFLTSRVGNAFIGLDHSTQYCNLGGASTYNLGKYTVSNNAVRQAGSNFNFAQEVLGPIDGPNTVSNNCSGSSCADPRVSPNNTPTPQPTSTITPQPTPTTAPNPTPTPTPATTVSPTPDTCPLASQGDANCDGQINTNDFDFWLANYGKSSTNPSTGDFNRDSVTDGIDYVIWLTHLSPSATPTPVPSTTPTTPPSVSSYFPYAIFEDGHMMGSRSNYQSTLNTLKANNITDIIYTNNTPYLDISDSSGFKIVGNPQLELNPQWWENSSVTQDLTTAKQIAQNIISSYGNHPSLVAWNLADDAGLYSTNKISLMVRAFNELAPTVPATVMAPGQGAFEASNPPLHLTYRYPAMVTNNKCDFTSKQIQSLYVNTFGQALELERENLKLEEKGVPFWLVLQAHGTTANTNPAETNITNLRTPSVEEARMQNWIALGEGVDGLGWFIYKTQQFWVGLEDNPALFAEVGDLARRVKPLSDLLLTLKKNDQQLFSAQAGTTLPFANQPYISTMLSKSTSKYYVIVNNSSCAQQQISINSAYSNASFKDLESGQTFQKNQAITFRPGDGKIFEVVGSVTPPQKTTGTNLVTNGSFESGTGTQLTGWSTNSSITKDSSTARSGSASMKISGPINSNYMVVPLASNLKPNTQYSISYWVKTSGVSGRGVNLRYAHLSPSLGFALTPLSFDSVSGSTDWRHVTHTFYTFQNLTSSRFDLMYDLSAGTAWVDDVVVCEGKLGCNGLF